MLGVRSDDALFVDKCLNRGKTPEQIHALAAETGRSLPKGFAAYRVEHILRQKAIMAALPDGIEQRTPEWYAARDGFITASDFHAASFATDAVRKRFVTNKAGQGAPFLGSAATRHGVKYEDLARLLYEYEMGTTVREYGLLPHKTVSIVAASPDGISAQAIAVEIKAPVTKTLSDIPPEYFAQMQGQMEVAELDLADFVVCRVEELDGSDFWPAFEAAYAAEYGFERFGAVGSTRGADMKFKHSQPGLSPDALKAWIAELPIDMDVSLHRVFDFRITRIERDDKFVADMIAKLRETWEMVLEARANPTKVIAPPAVSPLLRGFCFKNFGL
jgi:putative phage-type endonuclease